MSTNIDLHADKGSTFSVAVNVENKDGSAFDCTGYNVRGQVRKTYKSEYGANLSCDYLNQSEGLISLSLTAENTRSMKAGRYYYDVEIFTDSDTVIRVLDGIFEVSDRVTSESTDLSLGDNSVPLSHALRRDNPHEVTADQIQLGNVDNTADSNKPVSGPTQTALDLKADLSDTYTKGEVDTKVSNLVNSAPEALDTLNELAAALGDDENFASTVNAAITSNSSAITTLNSHASSETNPHNVSLGQLINVEFSNSLAPTQGQGILYDATTEKWYASDIEGGGGGGGGDINDQTHSIYVSKSGSNINSGLNVSDSKQTITSAIVAAENLIAAPGFVGSVRIDVLDAGRYFEGVVNISENIHLFAPTATFIGNITLRNNSSCVLDTHFANEPGGNLVNFVTATNSHYTANVLDLRGESGTQTAGVGIRSSQSGNSCKANVGEIYIPADGKGYQSDEDGNLTFGRVNLTGDNSTAFYIFGVDGGARTNIICGEIIASPTGSNTIGVYCAAANSKTTLICGEVDVAKVYSIPESSAELYIICPKISGDRTQDIIGVVKEISDITLDLKANQQDLAAHTTNTNNPHAVTATQVGLGNVDNTSDASKPISTSTQTALDLKATITDVDTQFTALIDEAPPELNTLGKLADAIGTGTGGSLTNDVISDVDVGSISKTDTVASGTSLQQFVEQLLLKTYFPTFVAPSASLSDNLASTVESGTTGINLTAGFNAGAINGFSSAGVWDPGLKQANRSGSATAYAFNGQSSQGSNTLSLPSEVITDGTNSFSVIIDYAEGPQPLDSLGQPYLTPLPAGSVSQSLNVNGRRNAFYGTNLNGLTSSSVRILSGTRLNPSNGTSFTINIPAGATDVAFAYPATLRDVTSVLYFEGLNADVKGSFGSPTLVNVEGANGYTAISYKVYSFVPPSPYEAASTYTVTI